MRKMVEFMKTDKANGIITGVKIIIMIFLTYLYLMHADLSTAPEFIYNQF